MDEKNKAGTPPAIKEKEVVITGLVLDTPQLNAVSNRYQQMVSLDAENLAALQAAEAALRADGKGGKTKRVIWGRPGHEYCYTNSSLEAALPGSGKEVGNKVTLILVESKGYLNVLAQVSEAAKAVQDAAKLKSLREQAAVVKENKTTLALLKSLGVNNNLSQLAIVTKVVGVEIGAGFGAAITAMENSPNSTPVSRSSRLAAANKEVQKETKVLAKPDEDDLDGED